MMCVLYKLCFLPWCYFGALLLVFTHSNDSEEEMFGNYDSFYGNNFLLAQVGTEHKHLQDKNMDTKAPGDIILGTFSQNFTRKK